MTTLRNADNAETLIRTALKVVGEPASGHRMMSSRRDACTVWQLLNRALAALSTPNAPVEQTRPEPSAALALSPATEVRREAIAREELMDLAEWARAVPEAFLADNSPNARHFKRIAEILSALPDEAAIRADEREKAIHEADQFVGALWSDLFNKDMVKAAGAYFFDKWRAQIRAIAIRNGGKQP